jgi:hypothetical protein
MNDQISFGERYLALTLGIDRRFPGYIDAYIGPPELKEAVEAGPLPALEALEDDLRWLQEHVPDADPQRERYLRTSLRAMGGTLRLLRGEELDYLDEVALLYDIHPQLVDEGQFLAAHAALEGLLPGNGSLAERLQARRAHYELAPEKVAPLLALAQEATRQRTAELVELVPGESLEVTLTSDQPWSAYNWYQGNARSLIEFNTDIPISALAILGTFAHEGYPGHHTEAQLKERYLYQQRGYDEQAVALLNSPAAVIAEAIATTATEIIFPGTAAHQWTHGILLPAAGIAPRETAAESAAIEEAMKELRYVTANAALLHHTGQLDRTATIDYLLTYSLATPQRAEQMFDFITYPLGRSYAFTYTEGYDLLARAAGDDKPTLFRRLLLEQVTPSDLAELRN